LKILFVAKDDTSTPSTNYRCYYLPEALNEQDVETAPIFPLKLQSSNWWFNLACRLLVITDRTIKLIQNRDVDALFVQGIPKRTETVPQLLWYRKMTGIPLIVNYDDANYLEQPDVTRRLTQEADLVLVPSSTLVEYATSLNNNVKRFPLGVQTDYFRPSGSKQEVSSPIEFVWVGHTEYQFDKLKFLANAFQTIHPDNNFRLRIVGPKYDKLKTQFSSYSTKVTITGLVSQKEVVKHLQESDVGLCPIPDNEWNNAKFPVKIMEMLSCGVPVIASSNSEASNIIEHGKDGFLPDHTISDWKQCLLNCLREPGQISSLSTAARTKAVNQYSMSTIAKILIDSVQSITKDSVQ